VQANNKAKEVMGKYWHGEGQTGSITSQASGGSSSGSAPKDASAAAVSSACDDACTAWSMPQLADEMWVSEDELARLFLVTSNMSRVLKVRSHMYAAIGVVMVQGCCVVPAVECTYNTT
jgi:hypothetical protein